MARSIADRGFVDPRAERQLRETEAKYRALVEAVPAVVYGCEFGDDGDWLFVSPQIEGLLGWTPEEWLTHPHPLGSSVHPDDRDVVGESERIGLAGGAVRCEFRMFARDGRMLWIEDQAAVVRDAVGRPMFMQGVWLDITERKHAEEELERLLRMERQRQAERAGLLDRTLRVAEEERVRLAAELHDGPVQSLASLLYGLELLRTRFRKQDVEGAEQLIAGLQDKVSDQVAALRGLMSGLRPPALDQLGLVDAVRDRAHAIQAGSDVVFDVEADLSERLPPQLETVLYRVSQEALTNVAKHARASHALVSLRAEGSAVILEVRDDGIGFEPVDPFGRDGTAGHFGLVAMRERVEMAGGRWQLSSRPGEGTWIQAVLPLEEERWTTQR